MCVCFNPLWYFTVVNERPGAHTTHTHPHTHGCSPPFTFSFILKVVAGFGFCNHPDEAKLSAAVNVCLLLLLCFFFRPFHVEPRNIVDDEQQERVSAEAAILNSRVHYYGRLTGSSDRLLVPPGPSPGFLTVAGLRSLARGHGSPLWGKSNSITCGCE